MDYNIKLSLALLVAVLASFLIFNRYGKNPKADPSQSFNPTEEDLTPLDYGIVRNSSINSRNPINSLFFYLASKGYLLIEEKQNDLFIHILKRYEGTNPIIIEFFEKLKPIEQQSDNYLATIYFPDTRKALNSKAIEEISSKSKYYSRKQRYTKSSIIAQKLIFTIGILAYIACFLVNLTTSDRPFINVLFDVISPAFVFAPIIFISTIISSIKGASTNGISKIVIIVSFVLLFGGFILFALFLFLLSLLGVKIDLQELYSVIAPTVNAILAAFILLIAFYTTKPSEEAMKIIGQMESFNNALRPDGGKLGYNPSFNIFNIENYSYSLAFRDSALFANKLRASINEAPDWFITDEQKEFDLYRFNSNMQNYINRLCDKELDDTSRAAYTKSQNH